MRLKIKISLNGTKENPFHKLNMTQNPFPQIGRAEYDGPERILNSLGGDPIPNVAYIREKLKGFSPEFIELCCTQYRPGEYVSFDITFDDTGPVCAGKEGM